MMQRSRQSLVKQILVPILGAIVLILVVNLPTAQAQRFRRSEGSPPSGRPESATPGERGPRGPVPSRGEGNQDEGRSRWSRGRGEGDRGGERGDRGGERGDRGGDREDRNRDERRRGDDPRRGDERQREREREERNREETRQRAPRKNPDLENQLKALDVDNNGKLDPLEANRVSLAVFRRLGLDAAQAISMDALLPLVDTPAIDELPLAELGEIEPVPEFGEAPRSKNEPDEFEVTKNDTLLDKRALEDRYSQFVIDQTRAMLTTYDLNNDRMLDAQEQSRVPWGLPEPSKSDLDKNGRLSEIELCERLAKRTSDGFVPANAEPKKPSSQENEEQSGRSRRVVSEPEKKARPKLSQQDRVANYVKELVEKYDKDGNGNLDEAEVKEMRSPPKPSVDANKDNVFSFEELYSHYSGGEKAKKPKSRSRSVADLPSTVFWDPLLPESGSGSGSSRDRSRGSSRNNKVPTLKFGIK